MPLTPSLHQLALTALGSERCLCGALKQRGKSFCRECYFALPQNLRRSLYFTMSEGYAEAWDEAKDWLRMNTERLSGREDKN